MTHFVYNEYTKMIGLKRKRHLFGAEKLKYFYFSAESTFQESVSKQNFYACARTKKSKVASIFRVHSV